MDILIKEINGKDEIWYSEKYLKSQIELAYRSGISKGIRIEWHSIIPTNETTINETLKEFKKRVDQEFQISLNSGDVVSNKWAH